ncbi:MAG TPA: NADH-quinone oxidoreductase subunit J [Candidatus Limnocylindria bacterium]|nr:NADH-quinone oxidoreductase subunit J [Candidatus Limnocylindria bacterium]
MVRHSVGGAPSEPAAYLTGWPLADATACARYARIGAGPRRRGAVERSTLSNGATTLDISSVLFFLLAIGVVGAGLAVVTVRNIIHSAVAMMVCFGSLAGMYALLGAPIVAAAQVLIYLGAISVLILFAIMLTQAGDANLPAPFHRQGPIAVVIALVIFGLVTWAVVQTDWGVAAQAVTANVEAIANSVFTTFALPFEIISFLLLAAIIGAIYLARRPEDDERAG